MAKRNVESQIVNLTFDREKLIITPISLRVGGMPHTIRKLLMKAAMFL
jgi:hypothetical protein